MVNTDMVLEVFSGILWSMDTMKKTHVSLLGVHDAIKDQTYLSTSDIVDYLNGEEKILFFSVTGGLTYKLDLNNLQQVGYDEKEKEELELYSIPFQPSEYTEKDLETIIEVL